MTASAHAQNPQKLRISAARSLADTGLVQALAKEFESRHPGLSIEISSVGALEALHRGRQGDACLIITHHPQDEELFMAEGYGEQRYQFMYSEYALFGPPSRLVDFSGNKNIADILKHFAAEEVDFLVPHPRSGTYRKIEELWAVVGIDPEWVGYENTGSSSYATLLQAANSEAFAIADMALYLSHPEQFKDNIVPMHWGEVILRNRYSVLVVNPTKIPKVNKKMARLFTEYLVSVEGQDFIKQYSEKHFRMSIWTPSAHLDEALRNKSIAAELDIKEKNILIMTGLIIVLAIFLISTMVMAIRIKHIERKRHETELHAKQAIFARDAALQANVLKSEFISTVSHELRTPLTSIMGAIGLLNERTMPDMPDGVKNLLDLAYRNADRLLLVINDLLDMEKIESGNMEYNFQSIDLDDLIKEAVIANEPFAEQYHVHLRYQRKNTGIKVNADTNRIMQVLTNLISNAVKFTPAGSTVKIAASRRNKNHVRVTISDLGPGIPKKYRLKIFEKFSQVESADTRQYGGTGLGLAISKELIEKHRGTIGLYDNKPRGTTFYFDLPI